MMGSIAASAMPATWPFLGPMFDEVARSGVAFSLPEFEMLVEKTTGVIEESAHLSRLPPCVAKCVVEHGTTASFHL